MPRVNFNYWALHYLNLWLSKDHEFCEALDGNDEVAKLRALTGAAAFYRVARNLPKAHDVDEDILRYKPVLDVIDALDPKTFQGAQLIPLIESVHSQISQRYGGRRVMSLTTKFLWLKMKSPIIIYDSQARKALGTKPGDIPAYYSRWREQFNSAYGEINAACALLPGVREYSVSADVPTPQYIEQIASQPWFKERVFDVYLWTLGS
jgi:hypothetical protein